VRKKILFKKGRALLPPASSKTISKEKLFKKVLHSVYDEGINLAAIAFGIDLAKLSCCAS